MSEESRTFRFEDHFSGHSEQYAQHRPSYPADIYAYLASLAPARSLAWDCGTGNGQAAIGLAKFFERVYATDASPEQIAQAYPHARVEYRVEPAEHVLLADSSVDLVTVAVAVHWFNFDAFYREAGRVLKPDGILAVWTYSFPEIFPAMDQLIRHYYYEVVGEHWPARIRYLEQGYVTLPFPFDEIAPPPFAMEVDWSLIQLAGFLDSWSATQRYRAQKGHHPLDVIWEDLLAAWGDEQTIRPVRWALHFRVGRNRPAGV